MFEERPRAYHENIPDLKGIFEKRVIPTVLAIMLISEKAAGINFASVDDWADSAIFYGKTHSS